VDIIPYHQEFEIAQTVIFDSILRVEASRTIVYVYSIECISIVLLKTATKESTPDLEYPPSSRMRPFQHFYCSSFSSLNFVGVI
jgi:hypothetical protein